ncbi:hypothetical protein Scep_010381 [Stephania cephalantha]|uniref:Uncharacterized protein n=1 Tax=Stephania cephalantha TaxID=152367 RepID=A0AAP0JX64_9MAGN
MDCLHLVYSCVLDSFHSICMNSIALDIVESVVLDIVKCCVYVLLDLLTQARHSYVWRVGAAMTVAKGRLHD